MLSMIVLGTVAFVALIWWVRRSWWGMRTERRPLAGIPLETLALDAFMQGNTYLAAEKFAEATAAFQRARELDPKRAHVVDRLAEVVRRQDAVLATAHP